MDARENEPPAPADKPLAPSPVCDGKKPEGDASRKSGFSWDQHAARAHSFSRNGFHGDVFRFAFAQCKMVAADLDFQRVAKRSGADENHRRARKKSHFAKAQKSSPLFWDFPDDGGGADRELRKCERCGHGVGREKGSNAAANQLNDDVLGRAIAQRDPSAAELTHQRALSGHLLNDRRFTKAHFAEALANIGLASEFANAASRADREFGEAHPLRAKTVDWVRHGRAASEMRPSFNVNKSSRRLADD
jgi:hypothetical protein